MSTLLPQNPTQYIDILSPINWVLPVASSWIHWPYIQLLTSSTDNEKKNPESVLFWLGDISTMEVIHFPVVMMVALCYIC